MPPSSSNACSPLSIHCHPLISYHLLNSLSCSLFSASLLRNTSHLLFSAHVFIEAYPLSLLTFHVLTPVLLFSPSLSLFLLFSLSSHHAGLLLAQGPAAYPPLFSCCISRLFLWGASCVCSPPYCVIQLIKWFGVDQDG